MNGLSEVGPVGCIAWGGQPVYDARPGILMRALRERLGVPGDPPCDWRPR